MNILKYLLSAKYRFFWQKYVNVQKSMWESDFKIAKSRGIREGIRQDRDRAVEAAGNVDAKIKEASTPELVQQYDALKENIRRYEAQMTMIDTEINGVAATGEDPGREGILDLMRTVAELRSMYKEYLRTI